MVEKIFILLVSGIVLFGCNNTKETYKEFKKTEELVQFPHPENWDLKENHGLTVLKYGKSSCSTEICHGADLQGGTSGISCYMCHSTYPHESGWTYGDKHSQEVLAGGKKQCQGCHGEDFAGGDTGVSCYSCHELYPHKTNWVGVTSHGIYTAVFGHSNCKECHGSDYNGGNSGVSCYACHALYPHENGWGNLTGHGYYLKAINFVNTTCATSCHGTDLGGGYSGISCNKCHPLYPHSIDWGSAPGFEHPHADYVEENGASECINCHVDIKGNYQNSNPKCQYCH